MARRGALPGRRSRRGFGGVFLLSLLLLAVGWSLFWVFAREQAERGLTAWLEVEQRQGRNWTCPGQRIGGFPLSISLSCDHPAFTDTEKPGFRGELGAIRAEAQLYFPTSVVVDLASPLVIADQALAGGVTVTWRDARLVLRGDLPSRLDRGNLEAQGIEIKAQAGRAPTSVGHGAVAFRRPKRPNADASADMEVSITAEQVHDPDADALFASVDPIGATLTARTGTLPNRGASLQTLLESWRQAGGVLTLERLDFAKGGFKAEGSGQIGIDEAHRLEGKLDTRLVGLEPIAARFGLPTGAVKIGGLLTGILGGKHAKPEADKSELALPLVARGGHLYLGPVKTGLDLPPFY